MDAAYTPLPRGIWVGEQFRCPADGCRTCDASTPHTNRGWARDDSQERVQRLECGSCGGFFTYVPPPRAQFVMGIAYRCPQCGSTDSHWKRTIAFNEIGAYESAYACYRCGQLMFQGVLPVLEETATASEA